MGNLDLIEGNIRNQLIYFDLTVFHDYSLLIYWKFKTHSQLDQIYFFHNHLQNILNADDFYYKVLLLEIFGIFNLLQDGVGPTELIWVLGDFFIGNPLQVYI
jgi:hypothetical protein